MNRLFTAYIVKDTESGMFIGYVPTITGAHSCAESIDVLNERLKEVVTLCLEGQDDADIDNLPSFTGISQIEVAE